MNGFRKGFGKVDNTISVQSTEDFTEDFTEDPSEALKIANVDGFRTFLNEEIAINLDETDKSLIGFGFLSFLTPKELIELVPSLEVRPDWTYDEFWEYWTKWTTDNNYYLNTLNQSVDQKKSY
eukprot:55846_1